MILKTPKSAAICDHCELPVPDGLCNPDRDHQFCCRGCESAYELIRENGLDAYYVMASRATSEGAMSISKQTNVSNSQFSEFDEPVFLKKFSIQTTETESELELEIEGIHCGACVWLLEKLPIIVDGVVQATVNWANRTIRIRWNTDLVKLSTIAATLNRLGYAPSPIQQNDRQKRWKLENRKHLSQIGIAAACAGNNMIISLALYLGMFSHMTSGMTQLLRFASCSIGLVALGWPGRTFLRSAWNAISSRTPHMDLPIALALAMGTLTGLLNVIRGTGEIYFDSLSVLIFLLLLGRWIQFRQQSHAANSIEMLFRLTPQKTRKLVNGEAVETLVDLIEIDDVLQILPGDLFPVDGQILQGNSQVDEAILSGESQEIEKGRGDDVSAGTQNITSMVLVTAKAIGKETRLSRIVELVEKASMDKPKLVLWANKIGGYFVAAVTLLAILTFSWWALVDVNVAIDRTIALLIVACPCALALATPLTIAVAIGRAANHKIMIKGGDVLQSLQQPGMVWLDKTGTLTEGELKVVEWYGDSHWVDLVAAIEKRFTHPVAKAITAYAKNIWNPLQELKLEDLNDSAREIIKCRTAILNVQHYPGMGISAMTGIHDFLIGSQKLLAKFRVTPNRHQLRLSKRMVAQGYSPCWISVDQKVVGLAAIGDSIRSDALPVLTHLKSRGWEIGILSGDLQEVVDRVAKRLKINPRFAIGGVTPEEKLATIQRSLSKDNVVMVGDGVNDSAALAAATVGIAVKSGAEASLSAAPVYLAETGLIPILELLEISKSTKRTMRVNLAVSLVYNFVFAGLAFAGFINPLVAAILMPISSLTVVALSLSAGRISGTFLSKEIV